MRTQLSQTFLIQPKDATNEFIVAFKVLPDAESAAKEFQRLTRMESTGGGGFIPPKVGGQVVTFGPSRILIRRANVLVTVLPKRAGERAYQEIEALIKFVDERIRIRGAGVITQTLPSQV